MAIDHGIDRGVVDQIAGIGVELRAPDAAARRAGTRLAVRSWTAAERHSHRCRRGNGRGWGPSSRSRSGRPQSSLQLPTASRSRTSPITRAGTPATIAYAGTSRVTTAPAATSAPAPIVTPAMIVALLPTAAPAHQRRLQPPVASHHRPASGAGRARVAVVGEHHAVRDHHRVLEHHARAQETVRRDLAAAADHAARLDLDERPDQCFVAYCATIEVYKARVRDLDPATHVDIGSNGHRPLLVSKTQLANVPSTIDAALGARRTPIGVSRRLSRWLHVEARTA